jgi:hypothetical protein
LRSAEANEAAKVYSITEDTMEGERKLWLGGTAVKHWGDYQEGCYQPFGKGLLIKLRNPGQQLRGRFHKKREGYN